MSIFRYIIRGIPDHPGTFILIGLSLMGLWARGLVGLGIMFGLYAIPYFYSAYERGKYDY